MEQILLQSVVTYMENRMASLRANCACKCGLLYMVTALEEKGRAIYVIHVEMCKAYDSVLCDILVSKVVVHLTDRALRSPAQCLSAEQ